MIRFPAAVAALLLCGTLGVGCGKKGPPLAPIIRIPAAVDRVSARRVGDDVYVTLTVPGQNVDASKPADIRRIEIYGATATLPPPRARFLEIAELVGTVSVAPPPSAGDEEKRSPDAGEKEDPDAVAQGAIVTVKDALSPEDLVARELAPLPNANTRRNQVLTPPVERRGDLRRFYLAIAYSTRGRVSLSTTEAELPLAALPEPPQDVQASYTATMTTISWEPSGGLIGFLLNQALPFERPPIDELAPFRGLTPSTPASEQPALPTTPLGAAPGGPPPGLTQENGAPGPVPPGAPVPDVPPAADGAVEPTRYNVYREVEPDPLLLESSSATNIAGQAALPSPLNPAPIDALSFTDDVEFERVRCYVVRAIKGIGARAIEGRGSERLCIKPVDVFPPAAPVGLSAVTAAGAISLIWEANAEDDVAGYLILRGSTADATLLPLIHVPIPETQFVDRSVSPGQRYVYAVVAVDNRVPIPNVSDESMRVEETAR